MVNTSPGDSRYIALTTYRRDGRGVTTPVWAAPLDGRLYVVTAENAGKTRRVRATGRVRVAPCNANGRRILGQWREGTGRIVQDEARRREALAALQRKYGWQLSLATLISRLRGNDRHRVILEVSPAPATEMPDPVYAEPGFFTRRVFDPLVAFFAGRFGLSLKGARVLSVRGRKSGEWHDTPVNPLSLAGRRYLVAPRGETQWVRNIRARREARRALGTATETVLVEEVADHEKPPILRAYLRAWAWEVNRFFPGVAADASDDVFARIASRYPVFRIGLSGPAVE